MHRRQPPAGPKAQMPRCAAGSPATKFGKIMTGPSSPPIRPAMFEASLNESFSRIPGDLMQGFILIADHARNAVPEDYGALGLPPGQFQRHIAHDIEALTRGLAHGLGCPALFLSIPIAAPMIPPSSCGCLTAPSSLATPISTKWSGSGASPAAGIDASLAQGIKPVLVSIPCGCPAGRGPSARRCRR
jgi:hypothetical protein